MVADNAIRVDEETLILIERYRLYDNEPYYVIIKRKLGGKKQNGRKKIRK